MIVPRIPKSTFLFLLAAMLLWAPAAKAQIARDYGGLSFVVEAGDITPEVPESSIDSLDVLESSTILPAEEVMNRKFYHALNDVLANNFTGAAQKLRSVRGISYKQGYTGLPDYSIELIGRAKASMAEGRDQAAKFLIAQAVELSPDHPRVNLLAASFYKLVGVGNALSYLGTTFASMHRYPFFFGTLILNFLLVGLVAMTASFLVVCVIQLLRNGELLLAECAKPFTIGIAQGLSSLPLFSGILGALAVWSLVLSYFKKGCRWLALMSGLAILAWGWGIPRMSMMGFNAETELFRVLEDINTGGYTPLGDELLFEELRHRPSDSYLLFAAAQSLHRKGLEFAASGLYQEVQVLTDERSSLYSTAALNLGALFYRDRRLAEAKKVLEQLEKRRIESFELYYNLALVHLALLDTANHREYYNKARAYDRGKLDALVVSTQESARVLHGRLPSSELSPLLMRRPPWLTNESYQSLVEAQQRLAASLMIGGNPSMLLFFGFLVAGLGGAVQMHWSRKKKKKRATISFSRILEPSRSSILWCALPAGMSLAGNSPIRGSWVFGLVLALLMFAFEAPMRLFQALPIEVSFSNMLFGMAIILVTISIGWSLLLRRGYEEFK